MPSILLTLPIALALAYLAKGIAVPGMAKQTGNYDNHHQRDQQSKLEGWPRRAIAAHYNGLEGFAAFAAGVLACTTVHVTSPLTAYLAWGYLVARAAYTACYVANVAVLRSLVWLAGFAASIGLMVLAAQAA
jgi:uncharacterized MAPEG superfamily protein